MIRVIESASGAQRVEAARAFLAALPAAGGTLVVGASTFGLHRMSLTQLAVQVAAGEMARLGAGG